MAPTGSHHLSFGRRRGASLATVAALVSAALLLGGGTASAGDSPTPASADGPVDRLVDVGGHSLYLSCRGAGSPTVIYLHGAIWSEQIVPHRNAIAIRDRLQDEVRVCLYDRRNTGLSDTVDAIQKPKDAMRDLEALLSAAGVEPPYVLLGASAGGLLSYLYANEHPDEVVGMVLLDAMFPDELSLEKYWPREDWYQSFHADDQCCTLERLSHWKVMQESQRHIGREPEIPVTYLTAGQDPRDQTGIAEYDARIMSVLAGYVSRFAPGEVIEVDAPHFMEPVVPDEIAAAVREVVDRAA
ncbi:alpha/beta fold hydrolase [Oryzobacter sp. R7]|uniref:alpha/beta fold hydrolase n=1 Tax=Oryzobacter faecalis TaxID=3388656 RepID=UPI00398C8653